MKYMKMAGVMALAATALMAFAATSLATKLTSPAGTTYTGTITGTSEGHVVLKGSFGVEIECNTHVKSKITGHGGSGVDTTATVEELSFTGCTNGYSGTVLQKGTLTFRASHALLSNGATITFITPLGINCEYTTINTDIGTVTYSDSTKATATVDLDAVITRTGHSFLCGGTGSLSGSLLISTPMELWHDAS